MFVAVAVAVAVALFVGRFGYNTAVAK